MSEASAGAVLPILLPLVSAMGYVAGALLLKRAAELGTGAWRIAAVCNLSSALFFAPLWFFGGKIPSADFWWQPAAVGLLFVLGQILSFSSLKIGDVTIATPVLGIKIILVAFLTSVVLRERVEPALWTAAIISTVAIVMLNTTRGARHHHVTPTILLAGGAAMAYALFDILVQKWSPLWGMGRFLPLMMFFVGIFSVPMFLLSDRETSTTSVKASRPWLAGGAVCLSVQGMMFIVAVAEYGQATVANVLYSSRGFWSVLAVWAVGHWFQNREQHLGARTLAWRLTGAALITVAIVLVIAAR